MRAANGGSALLFQSARLVAAVAELASFGDFAPLDLTERYFACRTRGKTQIFLT